MRSNRFAFMGTHGAGATDADSELSHEAPEEQAPPMTPPPHNELFVHDAAKVVYAAFLALDPPQQHKLLATMQRALAVPDRPVQSHQMRAREAHRALAEANALLGEPPSTSAFTLLRTEHPEYGWPDAKSVKRWLGASTWNDALALAHLERVPDGDALTVQRGPQYTRTELEEALRECATELHHPPSVNEYLAWVRRQDVRARPGRRASSRGPFVRVFETWENGLAAAGLVDAEEEAALLSDRGIRRACWFYTDESVLSALREVARRKGHSPRTSEYTAERQRIYAETRASGNARALPSLVTIHRRFVTWQQALLCAGLDPPPPQRRTDPYVRGGRALSDDEITEALKRAYAAIGEPFQRGRYAEWRRDLISRDRRERWSLPSPTTVFLRFGSWSAAVSRLNRGDGIP